MRLKFLLTTVIAGSLLLLSCNDRSGEPGGIPGTGNVPVEFGASIEGRDGTPTRATDTSWGDDQIGIFMYGQESLSQNTVWAANKKYVTYGTGSFSAATLGDYIFFPEDGSPVSFAAYYPYTEELDGFTYPVDLSDQSDPESLDLLYSVNVKNVTAGGEIPAFRFRHQLAQIRLELQPGTGRRDISGAVVKFTGVKTRAGFSLADGSFEIDAQSVGTVIVSASGTALSSTAMLLLIPEDNLSGIYAEVSLPDGTVFEPFPIVNSNASKTFEKGRSYTYTLKLTGDEIIPENYGWFETPAKTDIENTVFVYHMMPENEKPGERNYSMLYDTHYKIAYWVAYPMHTDYFNEGRHEKWAYDPKVEAQYQARLNGGSYANPTNDRGHQIANGDRNYSVAGSQSTFYSTNMTPQNNNLNQNIWRLLETQVRTWTAQCDTLYVVTGAMIVTADDQTVAYDQDNDGKDIAVPKYYFKALAKRIGDTYYTNAYRIDNRSYAGTGYTFNTFRTTVTALEEETGFTFFPFLSGEVKSAYVPGQWQ